MRHPVSGERLDRRIAMSPGVELWIFGNLTGGEEADVRSTLLSRYSEIERRRRVTRGVELNKGGRMRFALSKGAEVQRNSALRTAQTALQGEKAGNRDKIYFPELDGLRFLAFLSVFIYHFVIYTGVFYHSFLQYFWVGVDLFFVLSAYLFTKLLTAEYASTRAISFRKFYLRRIFRIWPIYFLFVGFVIAGYVFKHHIISKYVLLRIGGLLTFSDNLVSAIGGYKYSPLPFAIHLWTIGFEEQFYLFVPLIILLLVRLSIRRKIILFGFVFILFSGLRLWLIAGNSPHPSIYYLPFTHFEPILMGIVVGFGGLNFLVARIKPFILGIIGVFFFGFSCLLPNMEVTSYLLSLTYLFVGIFTSLTLVSVTNSAVLMRTFSQRALVYLGKRSYGLYVYHLLGLGTGKLVVNHIHSLHSNVWAMFLLGLGFTVLIAVTSYKVVEVPFLRLKKRFEVVASRPI